MADGEKIKWIRTRDIFFCAAFVLLVLSLLSYNVHDNAVLDGGSRGNIENLVGPLGASLASFLFLWFGLAVYPMLIILSLVLLRGFLSRKFELKRSKYYLGAVLMALLGFTLYFGINPENEWNISRTNELGIGRLSTDKDSGVINKLALPGGVVGQFLACPGVPEEDLPAGLIRGVIGEIGTSVIVWALFLAAAVLIFVDDWLPLLQYYNEHRSKQLPQQAPKKKTEEQESPEDDSRYRKTAEPQYLRPEEKTGQPAKASIWSRLFGRHEEQSGEAADTEGPVINDDDIPVLPPRSDGGAKAVSRNAVQRKVSVIQPEPEEVTAEDDDLPPWSAPAEAKPAPAAARPDPVSIQQFDANKGRNLAALAMEDRICADFELPSIKMMDQHNEKKVEDVDFLERSRGRLQQTLDSFSIDGHVARIIVGPRVTRFEITLEEGVEVSKVTRISNNIAMKMEAESVRILAPIPGRDAVGIEVPNKNSSTVYIRSVLESEQWSANTKAKIPIVLGKNVEGTAVVTDLAKAPHMLIAGSTGSGKSVCMNTLIMSLLFKFPPDDLRLILVDPKVVEMEAYARLPHLITPVVNDPKKVPLALRWGVNEMERRYRMMAKVHARDLTGFNTRAKDPEPVFDDDGKMIPQTMPYLVIIVDELADIMMTEAKKDVETSICRIAQKGRAAGVHLVIATQTPRKDVVTGLIKANLPVKIAFKVGTNMDSRVILDQGGAEKLLGMGDLLFNPPGAANLERIQMTLVTDDEIKRVVDFVSGQAEQHFNADVLREADISEGDTQELPLPRGNDEDEEWEDDPRVSDEFVDSVAAKYLQPGDSPLLRQALELVINERQASISFFQRRLGIGYNKSAELVDQLEKRNIVSRPLGGGQKRDILILDGLEIAE